MLLKINVFLVATEDPRAPLQLKTDFTVAGVG